MSNADSADMEPSVLDLAQLARIQGTHRGFLYQQAQREMESLAPYVSGLPEDGQIEIERQREIIRQRRARGPLTQRELAARSQRHAAQERVANLLRTRLGLPPGPQQVRAQKVPRNSPCTCGSGRKYKKCCGRP